MRTHSVKSWSTYWMAYQRLYSEKEKLTRISDAYFFRALYFFALKGKMYDEVEN